MGGYPYLIFRVPHEIASYRDLNESTMLPLEADIAGLRSKLSAVVPGVEWRTFGSELTGRVELGANDWMDFVFWTHIPGEHVSVNAANWRTTRPVLDGICKALGWTAADLYTWELFGANVKSAPA